MKGTSSDITDTAGYEYEALTAVVMKVVIFWDIAPCGFGGTYRLHLQGRKSVEQETSV
jgi:hypothetical protein